MSTSAGGAAKPIIKIDIDSEAFDKFEEKFERHKQDLAELPAEWQDTNAQITVLQSGFERAANEATRFAAAASNTKVMGGGGYLAQFEKHSKESSKSWTVITKQIEKAGKNLSGLARQSLGFNVLGSLPAGLGIAGGIIGLGLGLAERSANDLAEQNKRNRALGLEPGEEQAFDIDYAKAGGDSTTLAKVANAKADPREWHTFQSVGITPDQIQKSSVPDLAALLLQKAGDAFNAHGKNAMWADSQGLTKYLDLQGLRLASSYGDADYAAMHDKYKADVPMFAQKQSDLDAATGAKAELDAAWKSIETEFEKAMVQATPLLVDVGKAAQGLIKDFEASGGIPAVADKVKASFEKLNDEMKPVIELLAWVDTQVPQFTTDPQKMAPEDKAALDFGKRLADGFGKSWHDISTYMGWNHGGAQAKDSAEPPKAGNVKESDFKADPEREALFPALEKQYHMPAGLLRGVWDIESGGGTKHIGKDGKYLGSMQFDEPTAKLYGVNRFDERSSIVGGARLLNDAHKRYGDWESAVAYYDGFGGLDKARAKYGDEWRKHIKEYTSSDETPNYLNRLESKEGVRFHEPATTQAKAADKPDLMPHVLGRVANKLDDFAQQAAEQQRATSYAAAASRNVSQAGPQSPYAINVRVSTPPGSNTSVTAAGVPK